MEETSLFLSIGLLGSCIMLLIMHLIFTGTISGENLRVLVKVGTVSLLWASRTATVLYKGVT